MIVFANIVPMYAARAAEHSNKTLHALVLKAVNSLVGRDVSIILVYNVTGPA